MGSLYTAPGAQLSAVDVQAFEDSQVRGEGKQHQLMHGTRGGTLHWVTGPC
jgi:hypothetical protein